MRLTDRLPGLALLAGIGLLGYAVGTVTPIPGLVAAVAIGALIGNTRGYSARFAPGVRTNKLWLETGIVLMGAGIAVGAVLDAGPAVLGLVVAVVVGTVLFVELLSRRVLSIPEKLSSLLAAGAGVCGVSAVVSVAGSIDAEESHVAYASAAVLAFDALTLVVYPAVGTALSLPDAAYGVWAGATMFSTGPVAAAGFAYSETAGRWAVLVKLARNTLIGVVTVGYALYYARRADSGQLATERPGLAAVVSKVPRFLVGFLLLAVLGNTVLSAATVEALATLSDLLFLLAFAGLGLGLRTSKLRAAGVGPLAVLLASLVTFSAAVLAVVGVLF
ncbi:YeiH family protein [Halolamina sp.]|jgi:uncharacterized integral membrane protein (TIGR00698 family)|uniref:YeiH family protein n=1 Tax=Halolamina sp. TaxID=1940283 RepID=UPI00356AF05F